MSNPDTLKIPVSPPGRYKIEWGEDLITKVLTDTVLVDSGDYKESRKEYHAIHDALRREFKIKKGKASKELLCLRMANLFWRLRRLERYESGLIGQHFDTLAQEENYKISRAEAKKAKVSQTVPDELQTPAVCEETARRHWQMRKDRLKRLSFLTDEEMMYLVRMEGHLSRELYRCLNQIRGRKVVHGNGPEVPTIPSAKE